jgi:hypothetical protein
MISLTVGVGIALHPPKIAILQSKSFSFIASLTTQSVHHKTDEAYNCQYVQHFASYQFLFESKFSSAFK